MGMFPSNQPAVPSYHLPSILESRQGNRFKVGLIVCYLLIVFCWLALQLITIIYPQLMYDGPVVAAYLVKDQVVANAQIGPDPVLGTVDFYIKVLLFLLSGFIGTMFLLVYVLPKMKNKNVGILTSLMVVGYSIPLLNAFWNIFRNNDLVYYLTLNKIVIMAINAPLTWSLILFGYYLYEEMTHGEA